MDSTVIPGIFMATKIQNKALKRRFDAVRPLEFQGVAGKRNTYF